MAPARERRPLERKRTRKRAGSIPRFWLSNTTVRDPNSAQLRDRLDVIAARAPEFRRGTAYPRFDAVLTALGEMFEPAVDCEVARKAVLFGEQFGFIAVNRKPAAGDRWLSCHKSLRMFLDEVDAEAALASILIRQPFDEHTPIRSSVAILNLFTQAADRGLDRLHATWLAVAVTHDSETGWGARIDEFNAHVKQAGMVPFNHTNLAARLLPVSEATEAAVSELLAGDYDTEQAAIDAVLAAGTKLLPGARATRIERVAAAVAGYLVAGQHNTVREYLAADRSLKTIKSHTNQACAAVHYLAAAGCIERLDGQWYQITTFGREVAAAAPVRSPGYHALKQQQRDLDRHDFEGRNRQRQDRLRELFAGDRTDDGRAALAQRLCWAAAPNPGSYEWWAVRATFALVDAADVSRIVEGVRTKVAANVDEALTHAPGGGADGWIVEKSGRRINIEVTGIADHAQISKELEPVVRHSRDAAQADGETITVMVAPAYSARFVAYLLHDAEPDPHVTDWSPTRVVPLTEQQMQRLLGADQLDFSAFLDSAAELIDRHALDRGLSRGQLLLDAIETLVADTCGT